MTLRHLLFALCALIMGTAALPGVAAAQIEVDINQGNLKPVPIAIPAFSGGRGFSLRTSAARPSTSRTRTRSRLPSRRIFRPSQIWPGSIGRRG